MHKGLNITDEYFFTHEKTSEMHLLRFHMNTSGWLLYCIDENKIMLV